MLWNEDQLPRVKWEKKPLKRKWESVFSGTAQGQCSKGDSCSFSHDKQASGNSGGGKGHDRLLPHLILRQTA